jgi:hypothetical protein
MTKFGRFESGASEPIETYEGDYMRSELSHVQIFKGAELWGKDDFSELVAAIRLTNGQSVREIKAAEGPKPAKRRKSRADASPVSSAP